MSDPYWDKVIFALTMDDAASMDLAGNALTFGTGCYRESVTSGNGVSPVIGAVATLYCSGTYNQSFLHTPDSPDWDLGSSPFTISFWGWWYGNGYPTAIGNYDETTAGFPYGWQAIINSGRLEFNYATTAGVAKTTVSTVATVPTAAWFFGEVGCDGRYIYIFVDGVLKQTWDSGGTVDIRNSAKKLEVGCNWNATDWGSGSTRAWAGWMDEVVVTKGVCRHVSNYPLTYASINDYSRALPVSDISVGSWALTNAATVAAATTEANFFNPNLTKFISATTPTTCEVKLQEVIPWQEGEELPSIRAYVAPGAGALKISLKQGTTVISELTFMIATVDLFVDWELTLAEAQSITNYTDLRLAYQLL